MSSLSACTRRRRAGFSQVRRTAGTASSRSATTDRALLLEKMQAHLLAILEVCHLDFDAGHPHCGEGWVRLGDNNELAGAGRPSPQPSRGHRRKPLLEGEREQARGKSSAPYRSWPPEAAPGAPPPADCTAWADAGHVGLGIRAFHAPAPQPLGAHQWACKSQNQPEDAQSYLF